MEYRVLACLLAVLVVGCGGSSSSSSEGNEDTEEMLVDTFVNDPVAENDSDVPDVMLNTDSSPDTDAALDSDTGATADLDTETQEGGDAITSSDSDPGSVEPLPLDTLVTFLVNGLAPALVDGPVPAATGDESRPAIFSAPVNVEVLPSTAVQVEIAYNVTAPLRSMFVDQENTNEHLLFQLESSNDGGDQQESVVFTVDLPTANETRCYRLSVDDINSLVSEQHTICITALDDQSEVDGRSILFADFEDNSTLSTLSLDTGDVQVVGSTGFNLTDIAFSGVILYGITFGELVQIDPDTGESTSLGSYGSGSANALEGLDGVLYAANLEGEILSIDPDTVESTVLATIPDGGTSSGDLVIDSSQDEFLYGTAVVPGFLTDVLYSFDLVTGEVNLIGETGFLRVWGLAIFREQLVGLTQAGEFILIDTDTGNAAFVSQNENLSTAGATVAPEF